MHSEGPPLGEPPGFFRVGNFLVRPSLKTVSHFDGFENLSAADKPTRLPDKAMAVLLVLVERPREVCQRDFLLDTVWGPEREAFDRVLDNAISEIRKAFGDSARDARYIETISKQGYRLIAEVEMPEASGESVLPPKKPDPRPGTGDLATEGSEPSPAGADGETPTSTDSKAENHGWVERRRDRRRGSDRRQSPPERLVDWSRLRELGIYGLLFLVLVAGALWATFGTELVFRLRIEPTINHTGVSLFDDLSEPLIELLEQSSECGVDHMTIRVLPFMSNVRVTPVLEPGEAGEISLTLRVGGIESDLGGPEPILIGEDIAPRVLADRAARAIARTFDQLLCQSQALDPLHRAHHCEAAGLWLLGQQRYSPAERFLERAINADPKRFDSHDALANIRHILGNDRRALESLKRALAQGPPDDQKLELQRRQAQVGNQYPRERELLVEMRQLYDTAEADRAYGWWLLTHDRKCRTSQEVLRDALRRVDSDLPSLHVYLGEALLGCNQKEEAAKSYEKYAEEDPYNPSAHFLLAEMRRRTGDMEGAAEALRTARSLDRRHFGARFQLALLRADSGELREADRELRELYQDAYSPNDRSGVLVIRASLALRLEDFSRALELAEQAMEEKADPAMAHWIEGLIRLRALAAPEPGTASEVGATDEAIELERVELLVDKIDDLRIDRGTEWQMEYRHHLAGRLALARGEPQAAIDSMLRALQLGPLDRAFFHHSLAEAQAAAGREEMALRSFEDALAFNPSHLPSLCGAAALYRDRGEPAAADRLYDRARKLVDSRPDDPKFQRCIDDSRNLPAARTDR